MKYCTVLSTFCSKAHVFSFVTVVGCIFGLFRKHSIHKMDFLPEFSLIEKWMKFFFMIMLIKVSLGVGGPGNFKLGFGSVRFGSGQKIGFQLRFGFLKSTLVENAVKFC